MGKSGNPAKRAAQAASGGTITAVWASNSPVMGTGYGTQTKQAVSRMVNAGHRISIAANYGVEGQVTTWNGVRMWPRGYAQHSEDVLPAYVKAWAHETGDPNTLLMTLYDVWVYMSVLGKVDRIASWVPIDHMPAPERVLAFLSHPTVTPIAMSKFGRDMIERAGLECLYVPHALDGTYKPTPTVNGRTAREFIGIPEDAYLVTMNQANKGSSPSRKAWPENLMALAEFQSRHDDVWAYLHTEKSGSMGGVDLPRLAEAVGLDMARTRFADPFAMRMGVPAEMVAAIYTGTDVLLACSMGEGFGLTVLEAQATGTPVVVSNWTAQPELVGDGWCVDGQPYWNAPMSAWWLMPNVKLIADSLEQAYARGRYRSQEAIDFTKGYDADLVFDDYWRPALKVLAA
jgi:hypothetical protein